MRSTKNIYRKKILILDGATGTELQKLGMPHGVCPEAWCTENPEKIISVHKSYVQAGSNIIYTSTFGANRYKLADFGLQDAPGINFKLAKLARKAADEKVLVPGTRGSAGTRYVRVAGDIGPTGKFVEPFGEVSFDEAVGVFKEQVKGLLKGGVDLFVIETMIDIQEARAALIAVKELTDKPVIVTMTFEKDGRSLTGTDPVSALITLQSLGASAVGANCSTGPEAMAGFIRDMKHYAKVPLIAKPNAGMPALVGGQAVFEMGPKEFGAWAKTLVKAGANIIGGCCGTTPDHIDALAKAVRGMETQAPLKNIPVAISSARKSVFVSLKKGSFTVIGECINPTGKKALQEELRAGRTSLARSLAKDQEAKGAKALDVNVGVSGIDEKKVFKDVLAMLAKATELPLVLDSSSVEVIEEGLKLYPGRALINSISFERKKIKKLLPVAAKYGACFILLPLSDKEIPEKFGARKDIIRKVFSEARKLGFSKDDIIVDGLVMTVSSHPGAALETLKTIEWCAKNGFATTVGLSNVSFGLPKRALINAAFLAAAKAKGLSTAIMNPLADPVPVVRYASDVLLMRDKGAKKYIAEYSGQAKPPVSAPKESVSPLEKIRRAVMEGNKDDIGAFVRDALNGGDEAQRIVDEVVIPAINKVGEFFDRKEYFLPQLIASAEAVQEAFAILEPRLTEKTEKAAAKTVVILATVKGDIHDIGKNIVALLLRNHGFLVVDLGKDVSPARIISEAKKHDSPIIGLSALMTTTMVNMKEVISLAKDEGLDCRFLVGGAVVTKAYAESIGAGYANDGVEAVRAVKNISES